MDRFARVICLLSVLGASTAMAVTEPTPGPEPSSTPAPGERMAGRLRVMEKGRSRDCGVMVRKRDETGKYIWVVNGCPTLVDLVALDQCGNGKLDAGEACDPSLAAGACPIGQNCDALCEACVTGPPPPTPTPTPIRTPVPTPSPTPPPTLALCPQGDLTNEKIDGIAVRDWVSIRDGEVHTYCYTLTSSPIALQVYIADRTGADQCTWGTYEIIPPAGSGLATYISVGRGGGGAIPNPVPGTWVIRITEAVTPNCQDRYKIIIL